MFAASHNKIPCRTFFFHVLKETTTKNQVVTKGSRVVVTNLGEVSEPFVTSLPEKRGTHRDGKDRRMDVDRTAT